MNAQTVLMIVCACDGAGLVEGSGLGDFEDLLLGTSGARVIWVVGWAVLGCVGLYWVVLVAVWVVLVAIWAVHSPF